MKNSLYNDEMWNIKKTDKMYLKELKKLYDTVDKVEDEELRFNILKQIFKCEERVVELVKNKVKKE